MKIVFEVVALGIVCFLPLSLQAEQKKEDCWSYLRNAYTLRVMGAYQESLDEIEKHGACDKSEVKMSYFFHKGWTFHEIGEHQKAITAFTEGLKTQPEYLFAYWRRGMAYEALGDVENARKDYKKGYELGVAQHGDKFTEFISKNPPAKEKLVQDWAHNK